MYKAQTTVNKRLSGEIAPTPERGEDGGSSCQVPCVVLFGLVRKDAYSTMWRNHMVKSGDGSSFIESSRNGQSFLIRILVKEAQVA